MLLMAWGLSLVAGSQFNSEYLLLDASINLLSVVTTFMVAHKILQNWVYWFSLIWLLPIYICKWAMHYLLVCF